MKREARSVLPAVGVGSMSLFYNSHIWMNPVTLRELIIALSLAIGGLKLLTLRISDLDA